MLSIIKLSSYTFYIIVYVFPLFYVHNNLYKLCIKSINDDIFYRKRFKIEKTWFLKATR